MVRGAGDASPVDVRYRVSTVEDASVVPPRLRVVSGHEHTWELRAVLHDDGTAVNEFGCTGCEAVTYR
jgi:hypothetical protein